MRPLADVVSGFPRFQNDDQGLGDNVLNCYRGELTEQNLRFYVAPRSNFYTQDAMQVVRETFPSRFLDIRLSPHRKLENLLFTPVASCCKNGVQITTSWCPLLH